MVIFFLSHLLNVLVSFSQVYSILLQRWTSQCLNRPFSFHLPLIVGGMKGCCEEGRKERGREKWKTIYLDSIYQGQTIVIVDTSSLSIGSNEIYIHALRRDEVALSFFLSPLVGTLWQPSSLSHRECVSKTETFYAGIDLD